MNWERTARNTLCSPLSLDEAQYVFGDDFSWPSETVQVGLSTLAMGDCCAAEFAQCAHMAILLQKLVTEEKELLSLRGSVPRGLLHVGVIVDDLVVLEMVLKSARGEATVADERMQLARNAYATVGLEVNEKKALPMMIAADFGAWSWMVKLAFYDHRL